jgi:hypothetical protein
MFIANMQLNWGQHHVDGHYAADRLIAVYGEDSTALPAG